MAGSLFDRGYTDARGNVWAVRIDEDKAAIEGTDFAALTLDDNVDYMPRGMKMRGVNCVKSSGDGAGYIHRFVPCATETADLYTGETKEFEWNGDTWSVTSTKGETRRTPKAFNSGLVGESSQVGEDGEGGESGTT